MYINDYRKDMKGAHRNGKTVSWEKNRCTLEDQAHSNKVSLCSKCVEKELLHGRKVQIIGSRHKLRYLG